jgi:hypothetical protein
VEQEKYSRFLLLSSATRKALEKRFNLISFFRLNLITISFFPVLVKHFFLQVLSQLLDFYPIEQKDFMLF